jgi:hypothetical protein
MCRASRANKRLDIEHDELARRARPASLNNAQIGVPQRLRIAELCIASAILSRGRVI